MLCKAQTSKIEHNIEESQKCTHNTTTGQFNKYKLCTGLVFIYIEMHETNCIRTELYVRLLCIQLSSMQSAKCQSSSVFKYAVNCISSVFQVQYSIVNSQMHEFNCIWGIVFLVTHITMTINIHNCKELFHSFEYFQDVSVFLNSFKTSKLAVFDCLEQFSQKDEVKQ